MGLREFLESKVGTLSQNIILASGSLVRKKIALLSFPNVEILSVDCDEINPKEGSPYEVTKNNAIKKLHSALQILSDRDDFLLISADTVTSLYKNGSIVNLTEAKEKVKENTWEFFYKPYDRRDAKGQIQKLQGKTNYICTSMAVAVKNKEIKEYCFFDVASVLLKELNDSQIESYLDEELYEGSSGSIKVEESTSIILKTQGNITTMEGLITGTS